MYFLKEITDKTFWNNFVQNNFKFYSFLNSWEWLEFQEKEGEKIFRFGIYDEKKVLVGIIGMFLISAKRGTFLFCPHGPLILNNYFEVLKGIKKDLKKISQENGASFFRVNSLSKNTILNQKSYEKLGFKDSPMHMHAENTHLLDLKNSEEDLMKNLRKTTRYIINRGKKEGVLVEKDNSQKSIENLIKLHQQHSLRAKGNSYGAFSKKFILNLFESFEEKDISLFNAKFNGEIEASLVSIKFGKNCVYYIGASDIKNPKFSPAYLLQWTSILNAKNSGCETYNFWGVSPDENPKHPIAGVTKFKRGFGGNDFDLIHAKDLVFCWRKYFLNYLVENFRKWKRGYYFKKPE